MTGPGSTSNSNPDRDDQRRQVLSGVSEKPEFAGYSRLGLLAFFSPALAAFAATMYVLPREWTLWGIGATIGLCVLAAVGIAATPDHLTAGQYVGKVVRHHTQQPELVHDMNPDISQITQPVPDTILRKFSRLPGIRGYPYLGTDEYGPTQEIVPFERPYRGRYAVQREDGGLVGAVKVTPANMSTKDDEDWQTQVTDLARILSSTIEYDAQWFDTMRSVDYEPRRDRYDDLASNFARDSTHADTRREELRTAALSDIARERVGIIGLLEDTTKTCEHYFLVAVSPEEGVVDVNSDDGGLAGVPGIGYLITQKKLREQRGSPEHIDELLEKLDSRVKEVASKVRTLDGVKAYPLSSGEFSRVVADYYRGDDVYKFDNFSNIVHGSPTPENATHPEHEEGYDHLQGDPRTPIDDNMNVVEWAKSMYDQDKIEAEEFEAILDGLDGRADALSIDEILSADDPYHRDDDGQFAPPPDEINETDDGESVAANLALSLDDLDEKYQSLIAPESISRHDPNHLLIDEGTEGESYSSTLVVRDWPDRPPNGMLESVINFDSPGIRVTTSTHFTGKDIAEERRALKSKENALRIKAEEAAEKESMLTEKRRQEHAAAKDILETVENADTGLFTTNTYVEVRAPTEDLLTDAVRQIRSFLKELNADAKSLKHNHSKGYETVGPAVQNGVHEDVTMVGDGLASLIPWTTNNLIEPGGVEIGTHNDRCEPTILDLYKRETGYNVGIFGTIGSGKTTTLKSFLLKHKLANPSHRLVLCDPLQEFVGLTELLGGKRIEVGGDTAINPLRIEEASIGELRHEDADPLRDAKERALTFIESYYELENLALGEKRGIWQQAIRKAYRDNGITRDPATHSNESPTLQDVLAIIRDIARSPEEYVDEELQDDSRSKADLKERAIAIVNNDIEPFAEGESYHHLTKKTEIDISGEDVIYLDLKRYRNDGRAGLMMQLLVSQIHEQTKASDVPTQMALDEAHHMMKDSTNLAFLKQAVRHSRHYDLSIMFSTQSISEFFAADEDGDSGLTNDAQIIFNNMSIQIFHYLKKKEMSKINPDDLGLTQSEVDYITSAAAGENTAGYSEALLRVDQEGCFPIKVEMSYDLNPCEFAVHEFDPGKHGHDFYKFLQGKTDDWSWSYDWRSSTVYEQPGPATVEDLGDGEPTAAADGSGSFEDALLSYDPDTHGAFQKYIRSYVSDPAALDRAFRAEDSNEERTDQAATEDEAVDSRDSDGHTDKIDDAERTETVTDEDEPEAASEPKNPTETTTTDPDEEEGPEDERIGTDSEGENEVEDDGDESQEADPEPSEVKPDDEATEVDNEDEGEDVEIPEEDEEESEDESEELTTITGIGDSYSSTLREAGIETVEDLAVADLNSLEGEVLIASTLLSKWSDAARERSNTNSDDQSISSASSSGEAVEGVSDDD